ncbi:(2Fe-2S) ferredoxin domain-containing protein [Peptoniphilus equinus]|uniref:(2Fe-2S) ferredoxin domain-containing protein n=1 Tax=Peptoniphilus equinus TaxID=3016343 RepID=A0ABY7QUI9_9FIRM|nr:(2Fe-2S) ferredoxin domain-containing protein [Peptoniphilus equinus]WBW50439.1 (2Fe-2S) ferredoxin domain-containing protein [Peptoniphilus equinus]
MKVTICMGSRCTLLGANAIYDAVELLQDDICGPESDYCSADNLEIELSQCLNTEYCNSEDQAHRAPVVVIDDEIIFRATPQEVSAKIIEKLRS